MTEIEAFGDRFTVATYPPKHLPEKDLHRFSPDPFAFLRNFGTGLTNHSECPIINELYPN